jgi:hypothetical protein
MSKIQYDDFSILCVFVFGLCNWWVRLPYQNHQTKLRCTHGPHYTIIPHKKQKKPEKLKIKQQLYLLINHNIVHTAHDKWTTSNSLYQSLGWLDEINLVLQLQLLLNFWVLFYFFLPLGPLSFFLSNI